MGGKGEADIQEDGHVSVWETRTCGGDILRGEVESAKGSKSQEEIEFGTGPVELAVPGGNI